MVPPRFTFSILIEGSEVKPKQLPTGGADQPDFACSSALSGAPHRFCGSPGVRAIACKVVAA